MAGKTSSVNFGNLDFYAGQSSLPKGRYALFFEVGMEPARDGRQTTPRLGITITAHHLEAPYDKTPHFVSLGSKAHLSFAPDPKTGKSLIPIPGGPASTLQRNTNWHLFLKSLYDAGLPFGVFTDDFSTLDGVWVQTDNIPEPEERKAYATTAATGEAGAEERKGSGLVPVVSEILEGGMPWEGGGGMPGGSGVGSPAKTKSNATPKAPSKKAEAPTAPAPDEDNDDLDAVTDAVVKVLGESTTPSMSKLQLRTSVFKILQKSAGAEGAQKGMEVFGSDDKLSGILGPLGYAVKGSKVEPTE